MSTSLNDIRTPRHVPQFWQRIVWKELREALPIWTTLLLVSFICLWITLEFARARFYDAAAVFDCCHTLIAIFAVATGVFMFAGETEKRTLQVLQGLPVHPRKIVFAKLLPGLIGTLFAAALIALLTNVLLNSMSGGASADTSQTFGVRTLLLVPTLCYLLGVFAAMATRSAFYGFLLSAAFAFAIMFWIEVTWFGSHGQRTNEPYAVWLVLALASVIVASIAIWKAPDWIEGRLVRRRSRSQPIDATDDTRESNRVSKGLLSGRYTRLLWQSFRQASVPVLTCFSGVLLLWIGINPRLWAWLDGSKVDDGNLIAAYAIQMLIAAALVLIFGIAVFRRDHQHGSYRFFQQNVETARSLWFARLLPWWIGIVLVAMVFGLPVWGFLEEANGLLNRFGFNRSDVGIGILLQLSDQLLVLPLVVLLGSLAISQCASMFIRQPIIAVSVSLFVGGAFLAYAIYLVTINESLLLWLMPIVIAFFFATWFRSRYWLADSRAWRGWLVPVVAVLATVVVATSSLAHHRANQFSDLDFDMSNIATALGPNTNYRVDEMEFGNVESRRETAQLYRTAIDLLQDTQQKTTARRIDQLKAEADGQTELNLAWLNENDPSWFNLLYMINNRFEPVFAKQIYAQAPPGMDLERVQDQQIDRFVEANQSAIDLVLTASRQVDCEPFLDRADYKLRSVEADLLMTAMAAYADKMLRNGKSKLAMESIFAFDRTVQRTRLPFWSNDGLFERMLVTWADLPDQDATLIRSAIARVEGSWTGDEPTRFAAKLFGATKELDEQIREQLARDYSMIYRDLKGEQQVFQLAHSFWGIEQDDFLFDGHAASHVFHFLPWENVRLNRLLKRQAVNEFSWLFQNRGIRNDATVELEERSNYTTAIIQSSDPASRYSIPRSDQRLAPHVLLEDHFGNNYGLRYQLTRDLRQHRYLLMRLALAAYRAEHGEYPEALHELAEYFTRGLPKTLQHGHDFAWFPKGLPVPSFLGEPGNPRNQTVIEEVDVPLLLPFAVDSGVVTAEPIPFHRRDDEGETLEETELGIQLRKKVPHHIYQPLSGHWALPK